MKDKIKRVLKMLGPGFISGASDDDPTAIGTYAQSGAQFGYRQLWTTIFTVPFMIVAQEMSGRVGMVTGKGIVTIMREQYSKVFLYGVVITLFAINTVTIGADLSVLVTTLGFLTHIPQALLFIIIITLLITLQLFVDYEMYASVLKYTAIAFFAYVINAFIVKQNWGEALHYTLLPYITLKKAFLLNLVAILGTNISPYLFIWQASDEVEEEVERGEIPEPDSMRPIVKQDEVKSIFFDTSIGMLFSNAICFFIELTTAATLGKHGLTNIDSPVQAAQALEPLAGHYAFLLFAIGIVGSGFLAIPVLSASSAYAVTESLGKKVGFTNSILRAPFFYSMVIIATASGVIMNLFHLNPFSLLVYAAALNGLLTPIFIVILLVIANSKKIMGRYTNSRISNILGILLSLLTTVAAIALIAMWR